MNTNCLTLSPKNPNWDNKADKNLDYISNNVLLITSFGFGEIIWNPISDNVYLVIYV